MAKIKVPAGPQIFDARTNGQDTDEAEEIESTHAALRACSVSAPIHWSMAVSHFEHLLIGRRRNLESTKKRFKPAPEGARLAQAKCSGTCEPMGLAFCIFFSVRSFLFESLVCKLWQTHTCHHRTRGQLSWCMHSSRSNTSTFCSLLGRAQPQGLLHTDACAKAPHPTCYACLL
jgi:hypothetical protein